MMVPAGSIDCKVLTERPKWYRGPTETFVERLREFTLGGQPEREGQEWKCDLPALGIVLPALSDLLLKLSTPLQTRISEALAPQ